MPEFQVRDPAEPDPPAVSAVVGINTPWHEFRLESIIMKFYGDVCAMDGVFIYYLNRTYSYVFIFITVQFYRPRPRPRLGSSAGCRLLSIHIIATATATEPRWVIKYHHKRQNRMMMFEIWHFV